ncbi:hypothetical protein K1T71_010819 [Dendrolimus kikuchii]|uniref:Uncharacterized protein n=1 Tax=Dendrolimus kikuchii TaxID=765133 RepID=A0ACC1CQ20_9NEOP|nr:hypothetical protein K1T71_010819 [Dendrolimus kikuchii]
MTHYSSVFTNSCLRVPVDPISKMPKTAHERQYKQITEQCSIESSSTCSATAVDVDADRFKDFYKSIPDYNDIHHLTEDEFYSTLKSLREKKKLMLGLTDNHIDDSNRSVDRRYDSFFISNESSRPATIAAKTTAYNVRRKRFKEGKEFNDVKIGNLKVSYNTNSVSNKTNTCLKHPTRKKSFQGDCIHISKDLKVTTVNPSDDKGENRSKRNHSACSISWNDANIQSQNEVDDKFEHFFVGKKMSCSVPKANFDDNYDEFKTQSMPSSPSRLKRTLSPKREKSITIPKPFKMTERDEEVRMVNELRSLRKSFSDDMLHQKCERKKFRAKPVPIESRIPLYDKILEDQAMRRAITKINSEAELRAQMKPFSFTKREEKGINTICERAVYVLPKNKKKKKFKARPVPKNLFSNYFYDKMKEDEFFRSMNKRIRAEEMLRHANYPGNMAARDRSRLSTPAAHSDLPVDPSPINPSVSSPSQQRCQSPVKEKNKKHAFVKEDYVTISTQPFKFNTADRAAKKMENVAKKLYQESKSAESVGDSGGREGPGARALSALELRTTAAGRSNLAALLRAEAVRRKFEMETARRIAEQRRRAEMKQRDRLLRSKPVWHLVKNDHEEDIAIRLQTRRDEERMRREEFLHEMELMYGRVQQQPMLFERYYAPRSFSAPLDSLQVSPRKVLKKRSKNKTYHFNSPNRSRKVSINDTAEAFCGDVADYLNRMDIVDKYSDSEVNDS